MSNWARCSTSWLGNRIEEGHMLPGHVHVPMSIPPKYAVAQVVGFLEGKSTMHIDQAFGGWRWTS